jgi:hypothetical protein
VEGLLQKTRRRLQEASRHRPADVVDDDVEPAEGVVGGRGQGGDGIEVVQVGRNHHGPTAGRLDPARHLAELLDGPRRDDHVGPGFGQAHGGGRPDPPTGTGDHGDAVVKTEPVQNHRLSPSRRSAPGRQ